MGARAISGVVLMASAPAIPPGGAGSSPNTYPQWGFNNSGQVVEAKNESQKLSYSEQGYLDWFSSKAAAQNAYQGEQGVLGSGNLPSGLDAIGDFFNKLGQAGTWIRVAEVLLGLGLLIVGISKLASGTPIGNAAATAGKAAAIL